MDDWDEDTTSASIDVEKLRAQHEARKRACLTVLTGTMSGQLFKLEKGKISKIPTTFFINPATKTQLAYVGVLTVDQVGEMLNELAAESKRGTQVEADSEHPYLLG